MERKWEYDQTVGLTKMMILEGRLNMKAIITILSLISFSALGCQTEFPKALECRSAGSIDSGLLFEFDKIDSKTVEMRVLELGNILPEKS